MATTANMATTAPPSGWGLWWFWAWPVLPSVPQPAQPNLHPPLVSYVSPPIGYAAPPPEPVIANYFCASASQFYPDTAYCPEGWQLVLPAR
jgi:hypothetical protein